MILKSALMLNNILLVWLGKFNLFTHTFDILRHTPHMLVTDSHC